MSERGRIDMSHGFMKIIIKNQIERDSYHKEVAEEKINSKHGRPAGESNHRAKKPDRVVYHPPKQVTSPRKENAAVEDSAIASNKEDEAPPNPIFKLEYEDAEGKVHNLMVWENSDLATLSRSFGAQVGLTPALESALRRRLVEERDKLKT